MIFGASAGGLAAALTLTRAVREWWRQGFGRRHVAEKRLQRLGTNAQQDFFEAVLGLPPQIREDLPSGLRRAIWVDRDYAVGAIVEKAGAVVGYSIATRTPRFRPRFRSPGGSAVERGLVAKLLKVVPERVTGRLNWRILYRVVPDASIRLGRSRFADLGPQPTSLRADWWPKGYSYREAHYYGNPGFYQTFVYSNDSTAPPRRYAAMDVLFDPADLSLALVEWTQDSDADLNDIRGIGVFRASTPITSISVLRLGFEPDDPDADAVHVRSDDIRTFA